MKATVGTSSYLSYIMMVAAVGAALLVCSERLAWHTVQMRATQKTYIRGIGVAAPWEKESIAQSGGVVGFLVENNFFKTRLAEPPAVGELRKSLTLPAELYFPDIWTLFNYLSFMEQRSELFRAIDESFKREFFRDGRPCNAAQCPPGDSYGLSDENADKILTLISQNYLDRSISAFQVVSIAEGRQGIADLQTLTQSVSFSAAATVATDTYNRILVLGAFLGRYDLQSFRQYSKADYDLLETVVSKGEASGKANDVAISAYIDGLSKFRSNCFMSASFFFEQQIGKSRHAPLTELMSFMAMRSLTRPFVDLRNLQIEKNDGAILVVDCEKEKNAKEYLDRYAELDRKYRGNLRRKGFLADIAYYRTQMPYDPARAQEVRDAVNTLRGDESKEEAEPAPAVADQNPTKEDAAPAQTIDPAQPETIGSKLESSADVVANDKTMKGLPIFAWPVRARIVTAFGAKTNGKSNEGINLAVPEGTPVKVSAAGVVAYAGNEIKGYGNLVLVRHPNGYVTAYAHLRDLKVVRGESVERRATLGFSGQTGEVGSPQLHFEIRKGLSPVDPLQFLSGG